MRTVMNFRECSALPTVDGRRMRPGMLYRSGQLNKLRGSDLTEIHALGIKTMIDLRSEPERKGRFVLSGVRRVSLPLDFDQVTRVRLRPLMFRRGAEAQIIAAVNSVYIDMIPRVLPEIGKLFRLLLNTEAYPVLICCRAGRDRTGFACALIELALGVELPSIVRDYLRSNDDILPRTKRMLWAARGFSLGIAPTNNLRTAFTVYELYIRTIINRINAEFGGISQYLARCGVGDSEMGRLQDLLLE